ARGRVHAARLRLPRGERYFLASPPHRREPGRRRRARRRYVEPVADVHVHVYGPGFTATLMPPVTLRGDGRQYPIGNTANWARIVANIAAIVDELDRTFVAEIDEAAGQAPEWFDPGR